MISFHPVFSPRLPRRAGALSRFPLSVVLTIPFVTLMLLTAVTIGVISFRNGRMAVRDVADQLRGEIMIRIQEHLRSFLDVPRHITLANAMLIRRGDIPVGDPARLELHFRDQIEMAPLVSSIYFGNPAGGIVNAGREVQDDSRYVIHTDGFAAGPFTKYAVDRTGGRLRVVTRLDFFDARTRPWYTGAVERNGPFWSEAYILFTGGEMAIAASRPVRDNAGNLLGVASVDVFLSQIGAFLKTLSIGETGHAFIMDRGGRLIASSTDEVPFTISEDGKKREHRMARHSGVAVIQGAASVLESLGPDGWTRKSGRTTFSLDDQDYFLEFSSLRRDEPDWCIAVVIPETDFMGRITREQRTALLFSLAAALLAVLVGMGTARRIGRPISELTGAVQVLANETWEVTLPVTRIREIHSLTRSFEYMAGRLRTTLEHLTTEIAERRQVEGSLRDSEERLELVVRGADLGTWDWNVASGEAVFNDRWATMLGYRPDEISGRASSWKSRIHPDDLAEVTASLDDHLAGRTPIHQVEHRLRTQDGGWKWILAAGKVLVRDENGAPLRAVGIHQDISDRKRAEAELRESHERLEAALEELKEAQGKLVRQERLAAVGQLSAGIAHDFNNILMAILGGAELLYLSDEIPGWLKSEISAIIVSAQRAAHLIRQILDFSRQSIRSPKRIDMKPFLGELSGFLERTLPESIRLDLRMEEGEYPVEADPAQLQQMITNLAVNASDAMSRKGMLTISLSRSSARGQGICLICNRAVPGEWIRVSVSDTGAGIAPEILPRIFEPFFTTKEVGKGTGLGLSQVIGIVEQSGGHIFVDTRVEEGTTFHVLLPPADFSPEDEPEERETEFLPRGRGETILIVEDEAAVLEITRSMLEYLGYTVITATNGRDGLALYESRREDIVMVISDMVMPDMEGDELFERLRELDPTVMVVIMSGYPLVEKGARMLERGLVTWFQKPISFQHLAQTVRAAITRMREE